MVRLGKNIDLRDYDYNERAGAISFKGKIDLEKYLLAKNKKEGFKRLFLKKGKSGIPFGYLTTEDKVHMVGMPEGSDGNVFVVGGNGSGKSCGIAMPTLMYWDGTIFAIDLKGELTKRYSELHHQGRVSRPYIVFDPTQVEGLSYDPFWWLLEDDTSNLIENIWEIVLAIIPSTPEDNQPFWIESERALFAAALLYFFRLGLSFSEAICELMSTTISDLCQRLSDAEDAQVKMLLGDPVSLKADVLAAIDRGLRNKLMLFASDPYISHAFRGIREEARCFTWEDIKNANIFLRIPANKVELWGGAINLMLTQLFHYLERRPEQYDSKAIHISQTLLLLDEFARFGKLDMLPAAMATLRSKKVNICLFAQSIAQIDAIYGVLERRIILDNCQYIAILRANDPETQEPLCKLIGTRIQRHHSVSQQLDDSMKRTTGYAVQISEVRDWMICPHELADLDDVLLLTPHGFLRVQKYRWDDYVKPRKFVRNSPRVFLNYNKGARILMIEDRIKRASERAQAAEHHQRVTQKQANDKKRRQEDHRKYILGGLVLKYFPELNEIAPGNTRAKAQEQFQDVEALLAYLSDRRDVLQQLQAEASARPQLSSEEVNA